MILKQMLLYSKFLLEQIICEGDTAIDATVGNGHDTLFLSNLVGETGKVYGFDIQQQAIDKVKELNIKNACLICDGHQNIDLYVTEQVAGVIFNLGYLPSGDHSITTTADTTTVAISKILDILKTNGLIVLIVYHGHKGGKEERDGLLNFVQNLDQKRVSVLKYEFINQKNDAPFIIALEKLKNY
ncbi:MAG: hypothetical protein ATN35_10640 [Epulopiscium sp. Nele67-Bin004]|nr:MAG: hypothetical protein ATN35_10640 [Epulopiscium sp. Nele67-Bin004]